MKTSERVIDIIQNVISTEAPELDNKIDLGKLQINSINFLKIVVEIEEAFGIEFDDEEINFGLFGNIEEIAQLVDQKRGK